MAIAQQLSYSRSNAAPQLPARERARRPAAKPAPRRISRALIVSLVLAWLLLMTFALLLVHRNILVLAEAGSITRAREELALLEQRNQELEAQVMRASSVGEVEKWAVTHGMKLPATVRSVRGDPAAVAVRPDAQPATAADKAAPATGFWGSVKAYFAKDENLSSKQ